MQKQLFPKEVIENTVEAYLPKVTVKSQLIYSIIVSALIAAFVALPFIKIDISTQANGIIRTVAEKTEVKSLTSGRLEVVNVTENETVAPNQLLFKIVTDELDSQLDLASYNLEDNARKIKDLNVLNGVNKGNLFGNHTLQTPLYAQQLNSLRSVVQENLFAQRKIETELQSDRKLYDEQIISKREYDAKNYELTKLKAEYESLFQRQRSQWQADLSQFRNEAQRSKSEQQKITQQKQFYEIKAPVGGTVQQTTGKYEGSLVQAGETLLVISPDSNLLAECYVSPKDIGLLKVGMPVNFQVDAFNYNEWGLLPGEITDIANDFTLMNEQPIFKVKCQLLKKSLALRNGYAANLKKGMTLRGRFVVTQRTLFQLLYDTIDDWVNPKVASVLTL